MNVSSENIDELLASATKNGMYLVNDSNTDALEEEYEEGVITVDTLCEIVDPETTPFDSKYKARKLLDDLCNKLEATRTIASLEKKSDVIHRMNKKIASARVRLGTISWECEEPHNAQVDLELAAEYYFGGFVANINDVVGSDVEHEVTDEGIEDAKIKSHLSEDITPPPIHIEINDEAIDAMKCVNMLGILWAGRGQVKKSLLYLLSVKKMYHSASEALNTQLKLKLKKSFASDLDSIYTHNLFYLAQAYGNIGNSKKSSEYCRETLQRQLDAGFGGTVRGAFDWVKNCSSIADFYQSMEKPRHCALALSSAQKILNEKVSAKIKASSTPEELYVTEEDVLELEAEMNKKWARLDVKVLKLAFEFQMAKRHALESGEVLEDPVVGENDDDGEGLPSVPLAKVAVEPKSDLVLEDVGDTDGSSAVKSPPVSPPVPVSLPVPVSSASSRLQSSIFSGCVVNETPFLRFGEVASFETARLIFLRANSRIEEAKKKYVLDGFVTEHVTLLQEQSKLYHYLSVFETDSKHRMAMERRRIELLLPLLDTLNRTAFENLHKQLSYELGETYLCVLDIKLDKLREKGGGGGVDESKLKKSEVLKSNSYCKGVLAMFAHFTNLYSPAGGRLDGGYKVVDFEQCTVQQLSAAACIAPDESLFSGDEIRPFLNAHFMCCRALSKVISQADSKEGRAGHLVASLHRYDWLSKFGKQLCLRKGADLEDLFGAEMRICTDMVELLPSKIDRMHFRGESGLSI